MKIFSLVHWTRDKKGVSLDVWHVVNGRRALCGVTDSVTVKEG